MSVPTATWGWWRERDLLARCLLLSVAIHLLLYGTWSLGNRYHLWQSNLIPHWLLPVKSTADLVQQALKRAQEAQPREPELRFVEVSPAQATPDAPEKAPFYADKNSKAANPDIDVLSNVPKITGNQDKVFKTEDTKLSQAQPLQPSVPRPQPAEPLEEQSAQPKAEPRPSQAPGTLALAKPATKPEDTQGDAEKKQPEQKPRVRPRTLADARNLQNIQGLKVRQDGGVERRVELTSVDAKATPFGAYDAALIAAVQSHWYSLIDKSGSYGARSGKVIIEFRLMSDGRVVNLKITEQSVGEVLSTYCQLAIDGAAPFGIWPSDMRRLAGDHRDVRFTFYYD